MDFIIAIIYIILFIIMMVFVFSIAMLKPFMSKKEMVLILGVGFFIGASAGAGVVISHLFGAKDDKRLKYAVRTSMKL